MNRPPMILVVEDDDDTRRLYRTALTLAGFTVREARSGMEALQQIDRYAVALILLDLGLPGFDGWSVLDELSTDAETRKIPIVIVTGSSEPIDHARVDCVLRKPIAADAMVATVRRCLESK
jgi:CheY-like chemotaxis protein